MKSSLLIASTLMLCLYGCQAGSSTQVKETESQSPPATVPGPDNLLIGSWEGGVEAPKAEKNDVGAKFAEGMMQMLDFDLEFKDADSFSLSMMGIPTEGSYKLEGNSFELKAEKIMGMTPEEVAEMNKNTSKGGQFDMKEFEVPMKGEISADGKKLTIFGKSKTEGNMVFIRKKESQVGTSTVSEAEKAYVGEYVGDPSRIKKEDLTAEQQKDFEMMKSLIPNFKLNLRADNTYLQDVMIEMEGTWKLDGDKIRLNATKVMGIADAKATSESMNLKPESTDVLIADAKPGQPNLVFRRK